MKNIKVGSLQFSGIRSKEKIAQLTDKFENYLNKDYNIILKRIPNEMNSKNNMFKILYYLTKK